MDKIYIAGKVTGEDYADCERKFLAAEAAVTNLGAKPVNPLKHNDANEDWVNAMVTCLELIMSCQQIIMLPDWKASKGAQLEHGFAKSIGLKVIYLDEAPLIRKDSCEHKYPDGESAIVSACGFGFCQLCGWDDYWILREKQIDRKEVLA